ncbi:MAG: hypothetical protein ACXVXM_01740 [Nocardioidaceae bacterium]
MNDDNGTPDAPTNRPLPAPASAASADRLDDRPVGRGSRAVWSLRIIAAAAITSVALAGAGGAALAPASDGDSSGGSGGFQHGGPIPGQMNGGSWPGRPQGGMPAPRHGVLPKQLSSTGPERSRETT